MLEKAEFYQKRKEKREEIREILPPPLQLEFPAKKENGFLKENY